MSNSVTARYVDLLALPQVRPTFTTAIIGRAAYALVLLPLFYAVTDATGSIAVAGVSLALYGATASFLAPVRAWLIDHLGARRVLTVLVLLFGGALSALAMTSWLGGTGGLLLVLAATAGAVAPPLGPTMRVAWGTITPNAALLKKGLSFDAVVEELLYLMGPAIAGLGLAFIAPGPALLVPAALVIIGGLLFVATPTVGSMTPRTRATTEPGHEPKKIKPLIFEGRFVGLLLPALVVGAISGTLTVAVPVALAEYGGSTAAGIALGLFAGGSALGGLLYGALRVPGSPARQLVVLAGALLVSSSLLAFATGAVAVSSVLVVAGLFFSPVMIVAYVAAHSAGGQHRQNSATTWVNTSHNLGGAAGSALAGVLIQAAGLVPAILSMAAATLCLLVVSALLGWKDDNSEHDAESERALEVL
ncbi:MFS transporter [Cryobacterium sp. CG_9.6]|uniref:MFS transporter n=1 Tax=Cryobacterium sp. CG_9.6 TaxID=2760710 RepID=UPI0024750134|nr:MFS transporter [Cryobacterium sp. CG_9.6]MDH6238390.1 putative MFS family arabinose efflux permease [Cryobacterium sp. CG_9.6]